MTHDTISQPDFDVVSDKPLPAANHLQETANEAQAPSAPALETVEDTDPDPAPATQRAGRNNRLLSWLLWAVPTLLVLAALAAVGYWGHHSDWKIPKFSELSSGAPQEAKDWCAEHGVPASICVACNADLMPKGQLYGWCKQHGVAECVLNHPQLAQRKETPAVSQADFDRAGRALAVKDRPQNDPTCNLHLRRIQFASRQAADKAGIDIALVDRAPIVETVRANGEIVYDPTRVAHLSARSAGTVWRVEKNVGDAVEEGDVLALVSAAEVGQAKAALLQSLAQLELATKNYNRLSQLGEGIIEGRKVLEAETALSQARVSVHQAEQALVNLGLPVDVERLKQLPEHQRAAEIRLLGLSDKFAATLDAKATTANLLPLRATLDGLVVAREVVKGEVVSNAKSLFTIADPSRMWLMLNVPVEDAQYVEVGQKVLFRANGASHDDVGSISWMSTDVESVTRTVELRAELSNEDGHLRNETFGAGRIVLREEQDAIVVPNEAVHWEGCCFVAFVRNKDYFEKESYKVFHTRMVRPGVTNDGHTEIIAGLLPDEVIVAEGGGVLRAELLKGDLGAG